MLKFSYGIIFELPVAKWPSGSVPAHCRTFMAQGGQEYVQYIETLAKAGEMIKVGNVKPKRLFPNTLDQVRSLACPCSVPTDCFSILPRLFLQCVIDRDYVANRTH